MYYITISNGLLDGDHHNKMGASVWLYMWFIDKVTKIDEEGNGWVLGGKPINLADIKHMPRRSVQRYISVLKKEGYITVKYTMRGFIVGVIKAKKSFGRRTPKVAHLGAPEMAQVDTKSGAPLRQSGAPNKTVAVDSTVDTCAVAPEVESDHQSIVDIIDSFEPVNPAFGKWYSNKTQRSAISRMLEVHGKDRLTRVIALLPKTNTRPYMPTVTTPIQLEDKWAALAAGLIKEKEKFISNQRQHI